MAVRANYTGSATASPTNWTASDALAHATAINTYETQVNNLFGVPVSGDSTGVTDTAAIQAAHDALPAGGGRITLRAGYYYLTAAGVTFTKKTYLSGLGASGQDTQAITALISNSTTATGITVNAEGCVLDNFSLLNNTSSASTAGAGIRMQKAHMAKMSRLYIFNFYDNVKIEAGHYWTMMHCIIYGPTRYGVYINNSDHADSGDMTLDNVKFDCNGAQRAATAAVRWETGGGLRVSNCKINGSATYKFGIGFDIAYQGGVDSADIFVHNTSIENVNTTAIKLVRGSGSNKVSMVQIHGNEFMATPTFIQVGAGYENVSILNNVGLGATTAVDILSTAVKTRVRPNDWGISVTTPVAIASGATGVVVDKQTRYGDGIVVSDATSALVGAPVVDYSYDRPIDFTVSSTAAALFALNLDNFDGGVIEVGASGLHNSNGGFSVYRRVGYQTNGSGVVTITPITLEVVGSTTTSSGPQLTFVTASGGVTVKIATPDSNSIATGKAFIRVIGRPLQFRIGA